MDRSQRFAFHRVGCKREDVIVEVARSDFSEWRLSATGEREQDGSLCVAIYAKEARKAGFDTADGTVMFELISAAVTKMGEITAILGNWYPTSDNFAEFWRVINRGEGSKDEAAKSAWTGRRAVSHGFTRVDILEATTDVVRVRFSIQGEPR